MKKFSRVAFLLVIAAPVLATAAENAKLKKEISATIKPGKVHEECVELKAGTTIAYRFKASRPVPFNIHFHSGTAKDEKAEYAVKLDWADTADDVLSVATDQHYCWMWSNKQVTTESVTISGTLEIR
jgi:hypothetical protein